MAARLEGTRGTGPFLSRGKRRQSLQRIFARLLPVQWANTGSLTTWMLPPPVPLRAVPRPHSRSAGKTKRAPGIFEYRWLEMAFPMQPAWRWGNLPILRVEPFRFGLPEALELRIPPLIPAAHRGRAVMRFALP